MRPIYRFRRTHALRIWLARFLDQSRHDDRPYAPPSHRRLQCYNPLVASLKFSPPNDHLRRLAELHTRLRACRKCPSVCANAVHGPALTTKVMLIGQAPGIHEGVLGRPFAHTAGRTLFKWLGGATGADESTLRERIYFSAVARCFPGKAPSGKGDRAPNAAEIANCAEYLRAEIEVIRPELILAVGKVAIAEVLAAAGVTKDSPLESLVGRKLRTSFHGHEAEVIPLPHPSGVSRWPHSEPGKSRLAAALELLRRELPPLLEI